MFVRTCCSSIISPSVHADDVAHLRQHCSSFTTGSHHDTEYELNLNYLLPYSPKGSPQHDNWPAFPFAVPAPRTTRDINEVEHIEEEEVKRGPKRELTREESRRRLHAYQKKLADEGILGPPVPSHYKDLRMDRHGQPPLFSFGIIADIQYTDLDDSVSYMGIPRFYRHSLEVVKRAVSSWNEAGGVKFAIQYGDLVDGYCPHSQAVDTFNTVLKELRGLKGGRLYSVLGNHCLYHVSRKQLAELLEFPYHPDNCAYYSFRPYPGFLFIVLDAYDISLVGWADDHPKAMAARDLLGEKNPNRDKNIPDGLRGLDRRFVKFNGGFSDEQLDWLEEQLQSAERAGEKVVISCHVPVEPAALPTATCLAWNYDELLHVLHQHTCVVAFLSGHCHFGAYALDLASIHHRSLEAALECPTGTSSFGRVDVYSDRMCLVGEDRMISTDMVFHHQ